MKRKISALALLLLSYTTAFAQYSNQIIEEESNQPIPFASVFLVDFEFGVIADSLGRFTIKNELPSSFKVKISASGFETRMLIINQSDALVTLGISLDHQHLEINEVSVSSPRGGTRSENATYIERRDVGELNEVPATNMGEMLSQIPGVYTASTGSGVSKPVIRGFQGVRIVSLLNGVRLENQQWGGDHDFGLTDLGIGSVEVIKGPSSLLYGADALGGVLFFIDEEYATQSTYEIGASSQFESNTMGSKSALKFKIAKKNIRLIFAGNYTNYADYQLPNGQYVENSRFNGSAAKFGLGVNKKNWVMHLRYSFSNSYVGIIGGHQEEEDSLAVEEEHEDEFQIDTQARGISIPYQRYENHLISVENKLFKKKIEWQLLLAHSYNRLSEFEESNDEAAMQLSLNNTTYSLRSKVKLGNSIELIAGLQGGYQTNRNSGAEEELIPNATQIDNGLYAILYYDKSNWHVQGGLRYDIRLLQTTAPLSTGEEFKKQYGSPNFAIGTVYSGKKNTFRANISSGFRVPHLSELTADGEHHGASRYEIGNTNLTSERAFQLDLSDEIHGEHLEFVVNPFVNYIQNFIYLQETDIVIDDLPVFEYQQLPSALLFGGDLAVHYHPHFAHWLHWEPSFSFIYGQDQHGAPIPFMPQSRIMNSVKAAFNFKWKFKLENIVLQHAYHFDQYRVSGLESSSKGYNLVNLGVNFIYHSQAPIEMGVGVKNLFNESYIDHLSRLKNLGAQNAGRSVYVRIKVNFTGRIKQKRNSMVLSGDQYM